MPDFILNIGIKVMKIADVKKNSKKASQLLKSISNQNRLFLLCFLVEGKKSVSEIVAAVGISQSAVSQHLARLRHEGLVDCERKNRNIHYYICNNDVKKIIKTLHNIYC